MSALVSDSIPRVELDHDQAIFYLQRKDLLLKQGNIGWHLMTYQEQNLGWVNILPGRINNYYPKELRILKES
jgi:NOL1/NOP2/fmu family ribosome biogenesis protein